MLAVETELQEPVAALFLRALEREAEAEGFAAHFHVRDPGGTHVREFRRAGELLILKSQTVHSDHVRVNLESETFDIGPLVERAAGRAAADLLDTLISALGEALGDGARAKLRHEVEALLAKDV